MEVDRASEELGIGDAYLALYDGRDVDLDGSAVGLQQSHSFFVCNIQVIYDKAVQQADVHSSHGDFSAQVFRQRFCNPTS